MALRRTLLVLFSTFIFFSCASTPNPSNETKGSSGEGADSSTEVVTNIPLPDNSFRSYLYSIDSKVIEYIELGSADSLQQASSLIYKNAKGELGDKEKVMLNVCKEILELAWPSKKITWEVPDIQTENPYLPLIATARSGFYDYGANNTDFLTYTLPSLVLLTYTSRSDFYERSESDLSKALAMRPNSVLANYLMAMLKIRQRDGQAAQTYLAVAQKSAASSRELQIVETGILYFSGNYEKALLQGESLLTSENLMLYKLCADSALKIGNTAKAENYVMKVLQAEPENTNFILKRADILMTKGEYLKASSLLDAVAKKDSTSSLYLLERTRLLREWNKNNTSAAQTISEALVRYPEDSDVLLCAAEVASDSSSEINGKSAVELAREILEKDPANKKAQAICVLELYKSADFKEAYKISSELVKEQDAPRSVLFSHIDVCLALKNNDEAWNVASKLYSQAPEDEDVLHSYINVLVSTKHREQALSLINSKLESSSGKMKSFLYYQRSLLATGEEEIFADLRASLTANPRNKDALYRFYRIYYNKRDWRRAQYYLKQVVALEPRNSEFLALNAELDALLQR